MGSYRAPATSKGPGNRAFRCAHARGHDFTVGSQPHAPAPALRRSFGRCQLVRKPGEQLTACLGYEDEVLEGHSADPLVPEAWLDREHVAGDQRIVSCETEPRSFVNLESNAVSE